jgi:hypothetical protein
MYYSGKYYGQAPVTWFQWCYLWLRDHLESIRQSIRRRWNWMDSDD